MRNSENTKEEEILARISAELARQGKMQMKL